MSGPATTPCRCSELPAPHYQSTCLTRHLFEPGPNPLECRYCGRPRYSTIRGTDPYHKRDPHGFNGREAKR